MSAATATSLTCERRASTTPISLRLPDIGSRRCWRATRMRLARVSVLSDLRLAELLPANSFQGTLLVAKSLRTSFAAAGSKRPQLLSTLDFGRQIIRFSLPGGLFGLLAGIYFQLFRTCWKSFGTVGESTNVGVPLDPVTQNFIATAVGLLVAGFALYQTYYVFYRPEPRVLRKRLRLPRDRGGTILRPLADLPDLGKWIKAHFGVPLPVKELGHDGGERDKEERQIWYENNALVRSLLNYVAQRGGEAIKTDYGYRADMYHALGACRLAPPAAALCACAYALSAYHADFWANSGVSAAVAIFIWATAVFLLRIFDSNRKNAWYALTSQARQDLYAWFTTHPESPLLSSKAQEDDLPPID